MEIMTEQPLNKKIVSVLDSHMAYHERGLARRFCSCMAIRPRPISGAT